MTFFLVKIIRNIYTYVTLTILKYIILTIQTTHKIKAPKNKIIIIIIIII